MGIKAFIQTVLIAMLAIFWLDSSLQMAQSVGLGGSNDLLGTPVVKGQGGSQLIPDWLTPYNSGRQDLYLLEPGWHPNLNPTYAYGLNMDAADPFKEGLMIREKASSPNQLFLQSGTMLVAQGSLDLAEPYIMWANIAYWGSFTLYDLGQQILSKSNMAPGWYRITGAYPGFLGPHLYSFLSAGWASNNLSVMISAGGYPTSYSLTGRVVNQSGNGMPGAKIVISSREGGTFTTFSDAFGYYGMDVPTGLYTVTAHYPGYTFSQSGAWVWSEAVSAAAKIVGYPASGFAGASYFGGRGQVQGRVADRSGTGIASAEIRVDGVRTGILTNSSGRYEVALAPGLRRIGAEKAGYGIVPRSVQVVDGQTFTIDLVAKKTVILGSGY